jgi:hypothetical protein
MKLAPSHAARANAMVHLLGVFEAVGIGVVEPVIALDADGRAPFGARDFLGGKHCGVSIRFVQSLRHAA